MKIKKYLMLLSQLALSIGSSLSYAQSIEISTVNGLTGEKKVFEVVSNQISIPINYVKGWDKCIAIKMKQFKFDGVETIRGELYCKSLKNTVVGFSCVAKKSSYEVTIGHVFGGNFVIENSEQINADSFVEITLACKNY